MNFQKHFLLIKCVNMRDKNGTEVQYCSKSFTLALTM